MEKIKVAIVISFISIFVGILVMIGWIFSIPFLESLIPNAVTMKFSTAVCFVFSGVMIYFIARYRQGKTRMAQIVVPISGLVIFLFMLTIFLASIFGSDFAIREMFVKETPLAIQSVLPGSPSIITMIDFILIVISGILALSETRLTRFFPHLGIVVSITGIISLIGYLTNQPVLYYYIPNVSTAMAIHTSVLFTALGFALIMLKTNTKLQRVESTTIHTKLIFLFLSSSLIPIIFLLGLIFNTIDNLPNGSKIITSIILIGISTAISMSIFSIFISRSISKPISDIRNTAQQISDGNISVKADERTNDEIGELAKVLNQMVSSIVKYERLSAIGEIATRLAHDLRNPLTVIRSTIDLLTEDLKDKPEMRSSLDRITRAVLRMSHQINDVLGYVRTKPLELTNSSILDILGSAISNTIVFSTVEIDLPKNDVNIICDPNRLEIVFANLITNAIQSMNNIGHIYIRIKDEKDHLIIEMEDTGPGIPDDALQKIFEPLFTTKQTGTGLGLVTCKVIVEQHGGTINVKQPPTTFIIKIPKNS